MLHWRYVIRDALCECVCTITCIVPSTQHRDSHPGQILQESTRKGPTGRTKDSRAWGPWCGRPDSAPRPEGGTRWGGHIAATEILEHTRAACIQHRSPQKGNCGGSDARSVQRETCGKVLGSIAHARRKW